MTEVGWDVENEIIYVREKATASDIHLKAWAGQPGAFKAVRPVWGKAGTARRQRRERRRRSGEGRTPTMDKWAPAAE